MSLPLVRGFVCLIMVVQQSCELRMYPTNRVLSFAIRCIRSYRWTCRSCLMQTLKMPAKKTSCGAISVRYNDIESFLSAVLFASIDS